jgi:hypothetical protein
LTNSYSQYPEVVKFQMLVNPFLLFLNMHCFHMQVSVFFNCKLLQTHSPILTKLYIPITMLLYYSRYLHGLQHIPMQWNLFFDNKLKTKTLLNWNYELPVKNLIWKSPFSECVGTAIRCPILTTNNQIDCSYTGAWNSTNCHV